MPKSRLSHAKAGVQIPSPARGRPVVAFDFDGTLTVRDSFTSFLKWRAQGACLPGLVRLAPAALSYLAHRDRGRIKAAAVQEIELESSRARETLRREVAQIAVQAASKLLEREIDAKAHADLISKLATQI